MREALHVSGLLLFEFRQSSDRRTRAHRNRALELLQVATALHLGAWAFLTFDSNQRQLAAAEKLKVRP